MAHLSLNEFVAKQTRDACKHVSMLVIELCVGYMLADMLRA